MRHHKFRVGDIVRVTQDYAANGCPIGLLGRVLMSEKDRLRILWYGRATPYATSPVSSWALWRDDLEVVPADAAAYALLGHLED